MVERDPALRLSAEDYLSQERGKVFPEYFYSFLQSYMLIFSSSSPILSPDEKIERQVGLLMIVIMIPYYICANLPNSIYLLKMCVFAGRAPKNVINE